MKKNLSFSLLFLLCSLSPLFSQQRFIEGKKIRSGFWHGKPIQFYDQNVAFYVKHKVPLDSAESLTKIYGGKLLQYDPEDGWTIVEMEKGYDVIKRVEELEQDSTVKYPTPAVYDMKIVNRPVPVVKDTTNQGKTKKNNKQTSATKQDSIRQKRPTHKAIKQVPKKSE